MHTIFRISVVSITLLLGVTAVSALDRRFDRPKYKEQSSRLDACYSFGKNCGNKVADEYCKIQGFDRALNFETEYARPTKTMVDGQTCNASFCASFKHIVCTTRRANPGPRLGWPQRID